MKMRLVKTKPQTIHVTEMKDGDLAVIEPSWNDYGGTVVHRIDDTIYALGRPTMCWASILNTPPEKKPECRVRLLCPGDTIVIEEDKQ